jgi:N-acetylglutamate synthase-like GNAT family acetyltransferase
MKIEHYKKAVTNELMDLLLMADPDENAVKKYLKDSLVLVALEKASIAGVAIIVFGNDQVELKNIAVKEVYQGKGIAKLLISEAKRAAKNSGATSLIVCTGNSSLSQLALYQKCGFRMQSIHSDFFLSYPEPIFENGIQCLDMVALSTEL